MNGNSTPSESTPSQEPTPVQSTPTPEPAPTQYGITNVEELTQQPHNPLDSPNNDDTDVAAALQRETQDGKGPDPVPESDFDSFATEGVESDDLLPAEEVASQVLAGKWGASEVKRRRLAAAGYDPSEIARIVNRRLASGAASAFPTDLREDATAVIRGEWGSDEDEIKRNLDHAGKNPKLVWEERSKQLGLS